MSAWSVLPNATHIDRIIESLKTHPDIWTADFDTARGAARKEAFVATLNADRVAAWDAARVAVLNAADNASYDAAWEGAWSSIVALIAWDDSAQFLELTSDELEVWVRISDDLRAALLLSAVRAFGRIKELETL